MEGAYDCPVCGTSTPAGGDVETASIRSNVRALSGNTYRLWRCPGCGSIHARDDVDLEAAYRSYPFFRMETGTLLRASYRRLIDPIRKAGLSQGQRVLDFGCGSGLLTDYLRELGYDAVGYDRFSPQHCNPAALTEQYDAVIAQDVIEHDERPIELLARLDALCRPGGIVAIGTPNASGIDLRRPEKFVHSLHQPYHRHILSLSALLEAAGRNGWAQEGTFPTPYNMPVPSIPLVYHYMRCFDGVIDVLFDRPVNSARLWLSPETAFYAIFGYWLADESDVFVIFRKGGETAGGAVAS